MVQPEDMCYREAKFPINGVVSVDSVDTGMHTET